MNFLPWGSLYQETDGTTKIIYQTYKNLQDLYFTDFLGVMGQVFRWPIFAHVKWESECKTSSSGISAKPTILALFNVLMCTFSYLLHYWMMINFNYTKDGDLSDLTTLVIVKLSFLLLFWTMVYCIYLSSYKNIYWIQYIKIYTI